MPVVQTAVCLGSEDILENLLGESFRRKHGYKCTRVNVQAILYLFCVGSFLPMEGIPFHVFLFHPEQLEGTGLEDSPEGGEGYALYRILPSVLPVVPREGAPREFSSMPLEHCDRWSPY